MNLERIDTTGLAIAGLDPDALEDWHSFRKLGAGELLEQVFRINRDLEKTFDFARTILTQEDDRELMSNLCDALHYISEAVDELQDQVLPF